MFRMRYGFIFVLVVGDIGTLLTEEMQRLGVKMLDKVDLGVECLSSEEYVRPHQVRRCF